MNSSRKDKQEFLLEAEFAIQAVGKELKNEGMKELRNEEMKERKNEGICTSTYFLLSIS